jgi:hypothetical protein
LNTTICPPAAAGFGEKDCVPLRDTTVIVIALDDVVGVLEGDEGLDDEPPPDPQPAHASVTATTRNDLILRNDIDSFLR